MTDTVTPTYPTRPDVTLTGHDGNVFAVIGRCNRAARRDGWSDADVTRWNDHVTSCASYDDALTFVMSTFEVS